MKFNLISIALVAIGLTVVAWVARSFLLENARHQVLQEAKLMMESASATRNYTTEELKPLIATSSLNDHEFLLQTVPAYGAKDTFTRLRKKFPDYIYNEAALNPTNLSDYAADSMTDR